MKPSTKAVLFSIFVFPGAGQLVLKQKITGSIYITIAGTALYILMASAIKKR